MNLFAAASDLPTGYFPLFVLAIGVTFVVVAIAKLRMHAFLALSLAAILLGLMTPGLPGVSEEKSRWIQAVEIPMIEFGSAAGKIAFVIALASIIGICMLESGAADMIVRRFVRILGEGRAALALLASGFFLSIPVFFDTVFFLLIPLARALTLRSGKDYMLYVMAIGGAGAITHSMVAPTPGPLLVAEALKPAGVELGHSIVAGLIFGILPAILVLYVAKWMNARMNVPLRETPGASLADLNAIVNKKDSELPPFWLAVQPVVLPVLLIALASFLPVLVKASPGLLGAFGGEAGYKSVDTVVQFLGNKNVAMLFGTCVALFILARQKALNFGQLNETLGPPLETAGLIILITAAGGAFGAMIRHSGVGEVIKDIAMSGDTEQLGGVKCVLLAWIVTAVIRVAQGSATVAMITGVGLMAAILGDGSGLAFHPIYIFLAVGFGSIICSWMNDSGFWVVCKMSGFTERETLKSWTVLLTMISVVGLLQTLVAVAIFPMPPGQ
jgi:gluconate:H+ symporter, GntP family